MTTVATTRVRRRSSEIALALHRASSGLAFSEGRRGLRRGVLPCLVHQRLLGWLQPELVLDVGANRGQFSLDVARAAPAARVVAFEPLADEAFIYERIFTDRGRFTLHQVALAAAPGVGALHVSAARDSSSLLPIGEGQSKFFPGTEEVEQSLVEVQTLGHFGGELTGANRVLLKLDVQGAELEVIAGAGAVLENVRWIYAEVSFLELYEGQPLASDVIARLRTHGFELVHLGTPDVVAGRSVQVDALFERS